MVAVFARYRVTDPDSPTGSGQLVGQSYGRPLRPVRGRLYWGWRAESMSRRQLEEFGSMIVPGLLETYGGVRPVRAVAIRPTDPTR